MPRPVQKIENLNRLRALERPEPPWSRQSEPNEPNDTQVEFFRMAEKLNITIPAEEPMTLVPMCLIRAIVDRLRDVNS